MIFFKQSNLEVETKKKKNVTATKKKILIAIGSCLPASNFTPGIWLLLFIDMTCSLVFFETNESYSPQTLLIHILHAQAPVLEYCTQQYLFLL